MKRRINENAGDVGSFRFSPRILDALGVSAYNSVQKCLSELAANSYDADATVVKIGLPAHLNRNSQIEITDNGDGMSKDDFKQKFLFIGHNKRKEGQRTKKGRLLIGSKGLGKLAGFGIARTVEVVSRKSGQKATLVIDRETLDNAKTLSDHEFDIPVVPTKLRNGTSVMLRRMGSELHMPPAGVLRRHLFKTLPKATDFTVYVNGVECTSDDVRGEHSDFSATIPGLGDVSGSYVIANVRQPQPGLAVRVRGRIVKVTCPRSLIHS